MFVYITQNKILHLKTYFKSTVFQYFVWSNRHFPLPPLQYFIISKTGSAEYKCGIALYLRLRQWPCHKSLSDPEGQQDICGSPQYNGYMCDNVCVITGIHIFI